MFISKNDQKIWVVEYKDLDGWHASAYVGLGRDHGRSKLKDWRDVNYEVSKRLELKSRLTLYVPKEEKK